MNDEQITKWVKKHIVALGKCVAIALILALGVNAIVVAVALVEAGTVINVALLFWFAAYFISRTNKLQTEDYTISKKNVAEVKQFVAVAERRFQEQINPPEPWH
jgi:hypothetical protein